MGVLNVTPDSFSDGGRFLDHADAIAHGRRMVAEGADVVDVGGESSRPGAEPVSEAEELHRVLPVIEALAPLVRVSVDTCKASVAHAAIDAGASLLNDISASLHAVAAERKVGWVAMHMQGRPRTMQLAPAYDDVVADVRRELLARAEVGRAAGVEEIWVDPGIGFGKTAAHNWALLAHLDALVGAGWPVLVGTSRKGFLAAALATSDGAPGPVPSDDRLEGSVATAAWAMAQGARMVRAHDVRATVLAARLVAA
ncbi:MAG: dihydropteroate synthase [Acidimicrobiales bacterium]|nr:dihydropteroate synthase [Acidimicrobiales bacterium]